MQEFLAAVAGAVGVALYIDLRVGQAIRKRNAVTAERRRRVDEAHAAMLLAVWDVQDAVAMGLSADSCNSLRSIRDTAAARYFAAVGE